jgi:hypothetical protein
MSATHNVFTFFITVFSFVVVTFPKMQLSLKRAARNHGGIKAWQHNIFDNLRLSAVKSGKMQLTPAPSRPQTRWHASS